MESAPPVLIFETSTGLPESNKRDSHDSTLWLNRVILLRDFIRAPVSKPNADRVRKLSTGDPRRLWLAVKLLRPGF
ncbi:MAG: hypothetical protein JNL58_03355 [Planctomyces sp.]|nr:hypothetical protein [Planctomyces sp.]